MTDTHGAARPGQLSIDHAVIDDIRVVTLRGEIDHSICDRLSQALLPESGADPRTVVDLSGVTFMDSSGINALIAAHRAVVDAHGWLRVAAPQESVLRVMQIVGIDALVPCYPALPQALSN